MCLLLDTIGTVKTFDILAEKTELLGPNHGLEFFLQFGSLKFFFPKFGLEIFLPKSLEHFILQTCGAMTSHIPLIRTMMSTIGYAVLSGMNKKTTRRPRSPPMSSSPAGPTALPAPQPFLPHSPSSQPALIPAGPTAYRTTPLRRPRPWRRGPRFLLLSRPTSRWC